LPGGGGSAIVTVAPLQAVNVTPATALGVVGGGEQFTATGVFANGQTQDLTSLATWSSSDQTLATVGNTGGATARGIGTPTVTASFQGVSGSATFNVVPVASIAIAPAAPSLVPNSTLQLSATGTLADAASTQRGLTSLALWSSSNPAVATVNASGLVTAQAAGAATITATFQGVSATVPVTVLAPTSVAVTPAQATALPGGTVQFSATGTFVNGSTQDLTRQVAWSSGNGAVATIDAQGIATAVGVGSAGITATLAGVSGSATLAVARVTSLAVSPASPTVGVNGKVQLSAVGTLSDGTTMDLTQEVDWSSGNTVVATVGNAAGSKGLVTGSAVGSAPVTARLTGLSGTASDTATVTVTQSAPTTAGTALVTNFGSNSVSVVDAATNRVVSTLPVGAGPRGIAVNSATGRAYVVNSGSNTVSIVNVAAGSSTQVAVGAGPWGVAVDAAANRVYVTNSFGNTLSILDGATGATIATVAVGSTPRGVAVNPGINRVYVANSGGSSVSSVATASNAVTVFAVGNAPWGIAVRPATGRAYVTNSGSGTVSVLDTVGGRVVATISVGGRRRGWR
jgi:YVTN family beta-propeller protein